MDNKNELTDESLTKVTGGTVYIGGEEVSSIRDITGSRQRKSSDCTQKPLNQSNGYAHHVNYIEKINSDDYKE